MSATRLLNSILGLVLAAAALPLSALSTTPVNMPSGPGAPTKCDYFDPASCEDEANFNTASFDVGTQRWMFASAQNGHILLNRKSLSTGAWSWTPSLYAINMDAIDPTATIALGSVFRQSSAIYVNPANGSSYRWIMYFIFQGVSTPNSAGSVCVAFSNNGTSWTSPIWAVYSGTGAQRARACGTGAPGPVPAEAISGFHSSTTAIHLFHLEGDFSLLLPSATQNTTLTYYSTTSPSTPDVLSRVGTITSNGVTTLNKPGGTVNRFFINLDATYDPANGRVYLLRVYGAPYDLSNSSPPCESACPGGIATFPMRGQFYDMLVNGNFNLTVSASNSWNLLADLGDFFGHQTNDGGICRPYQLQTCALLSQHIPDMDSLTVHKTPTGLLYRNAQGQALVFASIWKNRPREQSCHYVWTLLPGQGPGGTWRDEELHEFLFPPTGLDAVICQ